MKREWGKIVFAAVAVLGLTLVVSGAEAKSSKSSTKKVSICHYTGKKYVLISVAQSALPAHMAHGDVAPGTLVGDTYYSEKCSVETVTTETDTLAGSTTGQSISLSCSTGVQVGYGCTPSDPSQVSCADTETGATATNIAAPETPAFDLTVSVMCAPQE